MSVPRVTVGIPFHDEARWLDAAVRSVLAQSFEDIELLLVDDGSGDGSLDVARAFRDPRVRVVSDGARRGLPARLNQIVALARSELVARMDADDVAHPERLARQLALLGRRPECAAVGTWAALVDESEAILAISEADPVSDPAVVIRRGLFPHATMLARRAFLQDNPYDVRLTRAEDRELFCRIARGASFAVVPEPLYVVRVDTRSTTFFDDYTRSQRQNRTILWRHGPAALGVARTTGLVVATYGKELVMRLALQAGLAPALVRRRGRPPTAADAAMVEAALRAASISG